MSDPSDIDQGIVVSRMVITRYLDADGNDSIGLETEGDDSLVSRLGALTLSIDTLIRTCSRSPETAPCA